MITEYEKFEMQGLGESSNWLLEVNYNKNPEQNECKVLKITFPDGKLSYIKREHLMSVLFTIGRPEDQVDLVPYKIRKSKWYETIVSIKAKKNIEKGENITFPLKITLPSVEEEVIKKTNKIITL